MLKGSVLFLVLVLQAAPAQASFASHMCMQPSPPYSDDAFAQDNFKHEVENYRRCMEDYVQEAERQQYDIQRQAQEARDELNNFMNSL